MAKAVLITKENKDKLAIQFNQDEGELDDAVDCYLVAEFGSKDDHFDVIDKATLDSVFVYTGHKLDNDFFQVLRRDMSSQ